MNRRTFLLAAAGCSLLRPLRVLAGESDAQSLFFADMHTHFGISGDPMSVREAMVRNRMRVG